MNCGKFFAIDKFKKNSRLRFCYEDDISFLKEVVFLNSIKNPETWNIVKYNLQSLTSKNFLIETIKQHLSGIEESYIERDNLLEEINVLCKNSNSNIEVINKKRFSTKEDKSVNTGKEDRERIAKAYESENQEPEVIVIQKETEEENLYEALKTRVDQPTSFLIFSYMQNLQKKRVQKDRNNRQNALNYLNTKHLAECDIKRQQLDLDKKKLALEERKQDLAEWKFLLQERAMEIDHQERQQKMQLEKDRFAFECSEKKGLSTYTMLANKLARFLKVEKIFLIATI
ncbi:hypothetical protein ABEB36_010613 [Hypothenemus hampei]|uniref:Uncharacterized protein n=1 Tax=Hypothenemus hampei TaxID=57062 RepID=A0ABD1ED63_HYPHA